MPRHPDPRFAPDCAIEVDGKRIAARAGESVAAAMLAAGRPLLARSAKYHRPRGPFCLAGSCGSCLVRADGEPNVRACRTPCRDGLRVATQNAFPSAAHDLLGVVDRMTPRGLDHHHLATWSRLANRIAVRLSRSLAGLGRLGGRAPSPYPPAAEERFDALVVGSGPAGLGAAQALADARRSVLLLDEAPRLGGRLRCGYALPDEPALGWAYEVAEAVRRAGGEVAVSSAALGLWRDGGRPLVAVHADAPSPRLRLVRADRIVLCTGGTPQPPFFENADLPGVLAGRGLAAALAEDGVVPGERAAILGSGPEAEALAAALGSAGMTAEVVPGEVARARGRTRVSGLVLADGSRVDCDTVAVATIPAPACELARQAGARVAFDAALGAFAVRADPVGSTGVDGLWVAGEATGPCSAAEAALAGRRAGEAARG
jgi:sarcosine oxidase subunit alpha